jgi:hypothetical protein
MAYEIAGKKKVLEKMSSGLLLLSAEILDQEVKAACNGFWSAPGTNDLMIWIEVNVEASCAIS